MAALFEMIAPAYSVLTRMGGDEFVMLILVSSEEMTEAHETAVLIIQALNMEPVKVNGVAIHMSASVGIAFVEPKKTLKELLHEADMAMYQAKASGQNTVHVL